MEILAVVDVYPHPYKSYFDVQFEELVKAGHSLRVFSGSRLQATANVPVTTLETLRTAPFELAARMLFAAVRSPGRTLAVLRSGKTLAQRIKLLAADCQLPRRAPDMILAQNLWSAVRLGYLKQVMADVPFMLYYHGGEVPAARQISSQDAAAALHAPDVIYTNTAHSAAAVMKRGGDRRKIRIVPVGFRIEDYRPLPPRADGGEPRLASVGRASKEKGFDHALRALALLKQRGVRFRYTMIGDGPEFESLRKLAAELSIDASVEFAGKLPHREVIARLTEVDALIAPSVPHGTCEEAQGCVLGEAMLVCAAVVATDVGGIKESLAPQMHEFLCPPGDHLRLADSIERLLATGRPRIRELGEAGRRFVAAHYDVRKLNEIIINGGERPAGENESLAVQPAT